MHSLIMRKLLHLMSPLFGIGAAYTARHGICRLMIIVVMLYTNHVKIEDFSIFYARPCYPFSDMINERRQEMARR
ncbi:uncharacterized protein K489DRAFT_196244 [Dissoconium aciculare CBS 342.82]|uniref:Uncharacterized protein n=1 Tax=Dissoconium aciculare CBS 342.82 TaxID=1314786 RepID=A0A6J3M6B9_9PEZI|nr:uncharacterized protein K489DRAFT_196244 [Dissoconium aciculare CBS 342.82]KAF1823443.1 hypothetical protein K489DRAFT_196244 [Dissoconium aciculare CBS 342.82]